MAGHVRTVIPSILRNFVVCGDRPAMNGRNYNDHAPSTGLVSAIFSALSARFTGRRSRSPVALALGGFRKPQNWLNPATFILLMLAAVLLAGCGAALAPLQEAAPAPPVTPLPAIVATLDLAPPGEQIVDALLDRAANRLYVSDSSPALHVLDATTYEQRSTWPAGGLLTLDATSQRLYLAPGSRYMPADEEAAIAIFDAQAEHLLEQRLPGRLIAVDEAGGRLFVGEPYTFDLQQADPGVRIYDAVTLEQTGVIPQSGAPAYNPLRDELLIAAYTLYTANPDSGQVTGELLSELREEAGFLWCNSCRWVDDVRVLASDGLVAVNVQAHSPQGAGSVSPPLFYDAATMERLTQPAEPGLLQADCGNGAMLAGSVDGRLLLNRRYVRYVVYDNLLVTDAQGRELRWWDGVRASFVNPATGQAYLSNGWVLDVATSTPVGQWPLMICIYQYDSSAGLLFGSDDRRHPGALLVMAGQGGEGAPLPPEPVSPPDGWEARALRSPGDTGDLLFVIGQDWEDAGALYRSTDGGDAWVRLRAGLPAPGDQLRLGLYFSPAFEDDGALYAWAVRDEYEGHGVLRSTDRGDTWRPLWNGLPHLRVDAMDFSPDFANDHTLEVRASYYRIDSSESGKSVFRSTDGGNAWVRIQ